MNKLKENLQIIAGCGVFALLLIGMGYNIGKPWNCQQAREMFQEAETRRNQAYTDAAAKLDENALIRTRAEDSKYYEAEGKMFDKCD
jgi:hypothetical protein